MSFHDPALRLPPLRRLAPLLAALALAALQLLAAGPAQARGHAHTTHQGRGCGATRPTHGSAALRASRPGACRTHVRRTARGVRRRLRRPAGRRAQGAQQSALGAVVASPTCDDGSAPSAQGCADGSEASSCPSGSTLDSQGGVGVCRAQPSPASGEFVCEEGASECSPWTVQPNCQDGHAAVKGGDGSYACADGSEPACEEAFTPIFQSGRLIACEPSLEDEEEEAEG